MAAVSTVHGAKQSIREIWDVNFGGTLNVALAIMEAAPACRLIQCSSALVYGSSLPPGVTIDDKASQTLLTGDKSVGSIVLKAAPDAKPVKDQMVPIMAHVSINFVMKFTYCAEPLKVTWVRSSR